jgi:hypothetical protein
MKVGELRLLFQNIYFQQIIIPEIKREIYNDNRVIRSETSNSFNEHLPENRAFKYMWQILTESEDR